MRFDRSFVGRDKLLSFGNLGAMIDKVVQLLKSDAIEKRIAAAIVLGELKLKSPDVTSALVATLDSGIPLLQRHALDALAQGKAGKALPAFIPLLLASQAEVRHAAHHGIVAYGEDALPIVKTHMVDASPELRRALDAVLGELGGKGAFSTLLNSLISQDEDATKAAATHVRAQVKQADARERKSYLAETEKFLAKLRASKKEPNVPAIVGAIKILGYIEDERAVPTLLSCATEKGSAPSVKQEAFIAVRFCMTGKKADKKLVDALVLATDAQDRTLAQTALLTLASLDVNDDAVKRLSSLIMHPDHNRAMLFIEQLAKKKGKEIAALLITALLQPDKTRAEAAAKGLTGNEDAVVPLTRALLDAKSADKAWLVRNALRPLAKKIVPAARKELLALAMDKLGKDGRNYEAYLDISRDADPKATAEAMRALFAKVDRSSNTDRALLVLRLICKSESATAEDRYMLASRELRAAKTDTSAARRQSDESLRALGDLLRKGFDVSKSLFKDKKLPVEALYYVGFHFTEMRSPLGQEILEEVIKRAGRAKIGKMAKNKLALAQAS
jgi:hypothetical protein